MKRGRPAGVGEIASEREDRGVRRLLARGGRLGFGRGLVVVWLLGLAVRLTDVLWLRWPHLPFGGDAFAYSGGANLFALGRGFVQPLSGFLGGPVRQTADHPPLYTLYLALVAFFDPAKYTSQLTFMLWSCVLGTMTIVLVALAARLIAGNRAGIIAGIIAAVYPGMWVHDGMLLSETMALFTAAGVLLFAYRFSAKPSMWRGVWLGFWCGAAALARPELVLTVPLLVVPVVLLYSRVPWSRRLGWTAAAVATSALVLAPWVGYNAARFKDPVLLSTNLGGTLVAANCHGTYYGKNMGFKDYECAHTNFQTVLAHHPNFGSLDQSQQDPLLRAQALKYVKSHIRRFPLVAGARIGRILGFYQPFQEVEIEHVLLKQQRTVEFSLVVGFWIVGSLAVAGGVILRRRRVPIWPAVVVPVIVAISVATTFGQLRYRAPAEAAVVVLAAVAVDAGVTALWRRRERRGVDPESSAEPPVGALTP
ncbi:MAG TPA: glycosyltransferase family 39 protein [Segeticoccus sp.]|uniref:glycosyltransferase family 39 protein n=1 Tax=Segeticoccus sp. TaxID=2706531 RepID=UPI002D81062E|nr:glycosyltransferase family 39 protein [Segeticoccus sp.]HET8601165.1 glycosyltransferase family 39 protein [Segeticoccus sp.]